MTEGTTPRPFVDVDEARVVPVPHRYVHGGFGGAQTRFSVYLPPAERWQGRFFSSIEGGPGGNETRAAAGAPGPGSLAFAAEMGAYLVETNSGHDVMSGRPASRGPNDAAVTSYGANAACARWAREFATTVYGRAPRYGYVFGPSGGAWRTVLCVENVEDVWDGALPFISGMGGGVNFPSLVGNVARVLGPALASVVDANDPGGSGDPFAGLTGQQRVELARLYRSGLQPGAEFSMIRSELEFRVMRVVGGMHEEFDPTYVDEFWTVPGYAGADGDLAKDLVDMTARVTRVLSADEVRALAPSANALVAAGGSDAVGITVDPSPMPDPRGAIMRRMDGGGQREVICVGRVGDTLAVDLSPGDRLDGIAAGDSVHISNRRYLAFCHLYRHQIDPEHVEAGQLMAAGVPIYPQRTVSVAHALTGMALSGRFNGKMIYVANLKDTATSPVSGAIGYRQRVRRTSGPEGEARLRTWFIDNASHVDGSRLPQGPPPVTSTRLVDWGGCIERALVALIRWVENGEEPPADTSFTYRDGRVHLPGSATERRGIQPVVVLHANGSERADVAQGVVVRLEVRAEAPPGTSRPLDVEWDLEGAGAWTKGPFELMADGASLRASAEHTYGRPGTFFPSVRVTTHPGAPLPDWSCRVVNLARARVVVASQHSLSGARLT